MKSNYLNKSGAVVGIQGSSLSKSAFALLNNEAGTHVPTKTETKRSKDTRIREYIKKLLISNSIPIFQTHKTTQKKEKVAEEMLSKEAILTRLFSLKNNNKFES